MCLWLTESVILKCLSTSNCYVFNFTSQHLLELVTMSRLLGLVKHCLINNTSTQNFNVTTRQFQSQVCHSNNLSHQQSYKNDIWQILKKIIDNFHIATTSSFDEESAYKGPKVAYKNKYSTFVDIVALLSIIKVKIN